MIGASQDALSASPGTINRSGLDDNQSLQSCDQPWHPGSAPPKNAALTVVTTRRGAFRDQPRSRNGEPTAKGARQLTPSAKTGP